MLQLVLQLVLRFETAASKTVFHAAVHAAVSKPQHTTAELQQTAAYCSILARARVEPSGHADR
jgi:hypothetical protein